MPANETISLIIDAQNRASAQLKAVQRDMNSMKRETGTATTVWDRFGKQVGLAEGALSEMQGAMPPVIAGLGSVAAAGAGAASVILSVGTAVVQGTMSFAEWGRHLNRTTALIHATGGAAKFTTSQLDELARDRDLATLGDRNEIMGAIDLMLTFKSVQGDVLTRSIGLGQDMQEVFGQSLKSAMTMLGKALEDPERGLTAMRRVGVSFTAEEEAMIKTMSRANDIIGAQTKILDTLEKQFGGAAEAAAQGLPGALDTLSYRWRDFLEGLEQTDAAIAGVEGVTAAVVELDAMMRGENGSSVFGLSGVASGGLLGRMLFGSWGPAKILSMVWAINEGLYQTGKVTGADNSLSALVQKYRDAETALNQMWSALPGIFSGDRDIWSGQLVGQMAAENERFARMHRSFQQSQGSKKGVAAFPEAPAPIPSNPELEMAIAQASGNPFDAQWLQFERDVEKWAEAVRAKKASQEQFDEWYSARAAQIQAAEKEAAEKKKKTEIDAEMLIAKASADRFDEQWLQLERDAAKNKQAVADKKLTQAQFDEWYSARDAQIRAAEKEAADRKAEADAREIAERKRKLDNFDREYRRITLGETQFAIEEARSKSAQLQAQAKDDAEKIAGIRKWEADEIARINQSAADKSKTSWDRYYESATNSAQAGFDAQISGAQSLEQSITSAYENGKFSALDFFNTVQAEMFRLQVARPFSASILDMFGSAFTGGGGGAEGGQSTASNHSGGIAGGAAVMRNIDPSIFAGAMRYHTGGLVGLAPDEVPIVALRGEEILTRSDSRHRANGGLSVPSGGAAGVNFTLNIHNESGQKLEAKQSDMRFDGVRFVMDCWVRGVAGNVNGAQDMLRNGGRK